MKEIQTKSGKILCVENNKEAYLIEPIDNPKLKYSIRFTNCPKIHSIEYNELEPSGKLSELTDKDCEEFVYYEGFAGTYYNYLYDNNEEKYDFNYGLTAKKSFITLLQSEGVDTSKEHLIIKIL